MCSGGSPAISASRGPGQDRAHGRRALAPDQHIAPARPDRRAVAEHQRTAVSASAAPPPRPRAPADSARALAVHEHGARRAPGCKGLGGRRRLARASTHPRRPRRTGPARCASGPLCGCTAGRIDPADGVHDVPARRRPVPRCRAAGRPRPSIAVQLGQATTMVAAPVSRASAMRMSGMRRLPGMSVNGARRLRRSNGLPGHGASFPRSGAPSRASSSRGASVSPL